MFPTRRRFGPTRSGADGRFRLPALKPDKPVTVWADAPGLARERRDDVRIFPGKDHDIGRLTLLPGTRIVGRVVDAQGKPVAGAGVKLDLYRSPARPHDLVAGDRVDAQRRQRRPLRHAPAPRR